MKVEWSEPAIVDLDGIWDFIARDSPCYATATVNRLMDAVAPLETFPRMGRHIPEIDEPDARELIVGSYRVMYRVEPDRVLIAGVIHGSRDLRGSGELWDPTQR